MVAAKIPLAKTAVECARRWRKKLGNSATKGKKDDPENAGDKQYQSEKDGERQHSGKKEMPAGYGLNRKDKDVHEIRKEKIPLIDCSGAHHDEGVHDVEVVVCDLRPEGTMQRMRRKSMVGRKEKESHQKTRDCNGAADLHARAWFRRRRR